ncbi:MAG: urate hydroxylase PuuD [Acidobacteriia bacterium]|nr:urate hydroxylase PuuD [Terriglobia bacterium]
MSLTHFATSLHALPQLLNMPQVAPGATEQLALRWIHIVAGIMWIGLLYFFNLVGTPTMKQLDAPVRGKVFPVMMTRAMWWFRWTAVVTVLAGLRYFWMVLSDDAYAAGHPVLAWRWLGEWLLVWVAAYALIYPLLLPRTGFLDRPWVRAIGIGAIAVAASWAVLALNAGAAASSSHRAISVGGGMGLLMLLNVWVVIWPAQKKLIAWTRASADEGKPMPPEAARLARGAFLASRTGFWISFPMLFLMAAAGHYPLLW